MVIRIAEHSSIYPDSDYHHPEPTDLSNKRGSDHTIT
jgi:hypothetical protein